jgi:prolycopene isomerase
MKKAVVIGTGVGGAAVSALLAQKGFSVTVFERSGFEGGKAASYERDGFVCDMGVHFTARGSNGPLGEVARRVGADLRFSEPNPVMRIVTPSRSYDFSPYLLRPLSLVKQALVAGVKPWNLPGGLRLFRQILRIREEPDAAVHDSVSVRDFLLRHTDDEGIHRLVNIFSGLMFVIPIEEASAGEFLWSFVGMARTGSLGYPMGGFGQIARSYLRAFERSGGEVRLKEAVRSIRVENGEVVGVETEKGVYEADLVVSNAGIRKTIEMAGEDCFPASYTDAAKRLKDSLGAVTIKYALDRRPFDIPVVVYMPEDMDWSQNMEMMSRGEVPNEVPILLPCPTFCDPSLAPPGKHVLLAGTAVPADLSASDMAEAVLDRMERKILELLPGIEKHILWKHRTNLSYIDGMGGRGAGEVIGLAQSYDQVGENKPDPRTPVEGLYLVGCDAGGRGIGTEQAADSALKVSKMILSEAQAPRMVVAEAKVPR